MASRQPRVGVITYPGSQDDRDALWALAALDAEAMPIWHEEDELPDPHAGVPPAGVSPPPLCSRRPTERSSSPRSSKRRASVRSLFYTPSASASSGRFASP